MSHLDGVHKCTMCVWRGRQALACRRVSGRIPHRGVCPRQVLLTGPCSDLLTQVAIPSIGTFVRAWCSFRLHLALRGAQARHRAAAAHAKKKTKRTTLQSRIVGSRGALRLGVGGRRCFRRCRQREAGVNCSVQLRADELRPRQATSQASCFASTWTRRLARGRSWAQRGAQRLTSTASTKSTLLELARLAALASTPERASAIAAAISRASARFCDAQQQRGGARGHAAIFARRASAARDRAHALSRLHVSGDGACSGRRLSRSVVHPHGVGKGTQMCSPAERNCLLEVQSMRVAEANSPAGRETTTPSVRPTPHASQSTHILPHGPGRCQPWAPQSACNDCGLAILHLRDPYRHHGDQFWNPRPQTHQRSVPGAPASESLGRCLRMLPALP